MDGKSRKSTNISYSEMKPIALITFVFLVQFISGCQSVKKQEQKIEVEKLKIAIDIYQKRCLAAGITVKKRIQNVDGIAILKVREESSSRMGQFTMSDPYGDDSHGEYYIQSFLKDGNRKNNFHAEDEKTVRDGFKFVEAIDSATGNVYRYTDSYGFVSRKTPPGATPPNKTWTRWEYVLKKQPIDKFSAKYGVIFEDISTVQDRKYWIAGSSLKVIDLTTNEVIAERVGYMIDRGQGDSNQRDPWVFAAANACPDFRNRFRYPIKQNLSPSGYQVFQTTDFVQFVITPSK